MGIPVGLDIMTGREGLFPKGPVGDRGDRDEPIGRQFRCRQNAKVARRLRSSNSLRRLMADCKKPSSKQKLTIFWLIECLPLEVQIRSNGAIPLNGFVHLGIARGFRGVLEPDLEVDQGGVTHRLGRRAEGIQ